MRPAQVNSRSKKELFFLVAATMQKVKRPQHIARKEHARYINELERNVVMKEKEVEKMRKAIAAQEQQLAAIPDFAITFVEKQMKLNKHHADLDDINKRLDEELKKLKDVPIEDRTAAVQETYTQRIATLDERIAKAREFKTTLEAHQKEIDEKKLLLDSRASDIEAAKASHSEKLTKISASKHVLAELKQKLEAERSSVESKLHTQKRESEKITRVLERRNAYMESVQKHLKENSVAIMAEQVKRLLEDFKTYTPPFMAARAEFLSVRRRYLATSKSPLTVYDPLPRVVIGEGELWEKIDMEARNMEIQSKAQLSNEDTSGVKADVPEAHSIAVNAQTSCCPADPEHGLPHEQAEELLVEEHLAEEIEKSKDILDTQ